MKEVTFPIKYMLHDDAYIDWLSIPLDGGNRVNESSKNLSPKRFIRRRKRSKAARKARAKARQGL